MSAQQLLLTRHSQPGSPSMFPSQPAFPESAFRLPDEGDSLPPLPDHFPEPHADCDSGGPECSSVDGPGAVYCSTKQVVKNGVGHGVVVPLDAKAGLRRITGKYAAPTGLVLNGSCKKSPPAVAPKGVLSQSPSHVSSKNSPAVSPRGSVSHNSYSPAVSPKGSVSHNSPYSPAVSPKGSVSLSPPLSPTACSSPSFSYDPHPATVMYGGHKTGSAGPVQQNGGVTTSLSTSSRLAPLSVSAFSDVSSDMSDACPSPAFTDSTRSGSFSGRKGVGGGGGGGGGGGEGGGGGGGGRYQSVSGISLTTSLAEGVGEEDVQQVEMFYRSHKTQVTVCRSLVNLYFGTAPPTDAATTLPHPAGTGTGGGSPGELWEFVTTGIPLLVLDSGDHHRARQLTVVMAEKGTGFVLWKDVVSHLTRYSCPHANFHTLRLSSDSNKLAGLSFDDSKAAAEFSASLRKLTADPDDELLMLSKKGKKKKKKQQQESKKKGKFKPPRKTDISQPCCFQHITKLERPQVTGSMPLPPNGFPPAPGGSVSSLTDALHDRLTLSLSRAHSHSSGLSDSTNGH